jgi:hypothetical protein
LPQFVPQPPQVPQVPQFPLKKTRTSMIMMIHTQQLPLLFPQNI